MNQVKRQLSFSNRETKKLRITTDEISNRILTTSLEDLSNELFYEIFDYFDGCEIYEIFSNLNNRFHQLLNSSSLLFKIQLDSISNETSMNNSKQFLLVNRHQIFSIYIGGSSFMTHFISLFTTDSSFDRLESLAINERMKLDILIVLLTKLACLPRLFSLTFEISNTLENLNDVYRLIFSFPMLKFNKFACCGVNSPITLPIATSKQTSTIEYLTMDHSCTFIELAVILSYTPQLSRLYFMHGDDKSANLEVIVPLTLSNLTSISLYISCATFDEFEIFISKINFKLKVLTLHCFSENMAYLDANRWEQFISKYLPQLEKFYLKYYLRYEDDYEIPIYPGEPNKFNSSFWIERQWIFDADIDYNEIIYSIAPYKERWYEYAQHKMIDSSKSMQLIIGMDYSDDLMERTISHVLSVAEIYHLEIFQVFAGTLSDILISLLELDSLKIYSLSLSQPRCLSIEETDLLSFISKKNQITKVYLNKMSDIEEVYFLIELCPRMTYLKVNCLNNMDMELFVRLVLIKSDHDLRLLSFPAAAADDGIIEKLEKMINSEKLLLDYTIKQVRDDIDVQWK